MNRLQQLLGILLVMMKNFQAKQNHKNPQKNLHFCLCRNKITTEKRQDQGKWINLPALAVLQWTIKDTPPNVPTPSQQ
jgi:hypothetical protein